MVAYLKGRDSKGDCCSGCDGIEECFCDDPEEPERIYICTFCHALDSAPSVITETRLYSASYTCRGITDWTSDTLYDAYTDQPMGLVYFQNKIENIWTRTSTDPAYKFDYFFNAVTGQYFTETVLDANDQPISCGISTATYTSDTSTSAGMLYASGGCGETMTVFTGGEGRIGWTSGSNYAGGWLNSSGTAHFISPYHTSRRIECETEDDLYE
jgi:hypothetical protein